RFGVGLPHRHGTPLVCADRRVRYDAVSRIFLGIRAELCGVEPDQGYLIEKRSIPDHFAFRIHRVRQLLWAAEGKILGLDDLSCSNAEREHESITALRPSNFWIVSGGDRDPLDDETESQHCLQKGPAVSIQRLGGRRKAAEAWSRAKQA